MSMPKLPDLNPDITCESALNMILASIAMEEMALSHIINAEGEKLQYVLGTLESNNGKDASIDEVLAINESISNLLEIVSQNQMILKNKMDKVVQTLSDGCPGKIGPTGPPGPQGPPGPACSCLSKCRCSVVFKSSQREITWRTGCAMTWHQEYLKGSCACINSSDNSKIMLCSIGRFFISFAINSKIKSNLRCNIIINLNLQNTNTEQCSTLFTYNDYINSPNQSFTAAMSGIIVDISKNCGDFSLCLELVSSESLIVEHAMLSIIEI